MSPAMHIDNTVYQTKGHLWWDENENAASLRFFINPIRFAYFQEILAARPRDGGRPCTVLDVGCGGGFLSEEFAKAGFAVTGIDPAEESVACARAHATASGLKIEYRTGCGENIPAGDAQFDIVLCCDVLEHVDAIAPVLCEIARVLKPGGLFFYDTINRTVASYLLAIKVLQEWRWTAQHEPRTHVWDKFIRPAELSAAMAQVGLICQENQGFSASGNPFSHLVNLRRRVKGAITFRELGRRLAMRRSRNITVSYMGYAIKEEGFTS